MNEKKYELEYIPCPLCGGDKSSIYIQNAKELYNDMDEYFNVEVCDECGHYFTNPRPTKETISYFYPDSAGYYSPSKYKEPKSFLYNSYKSVLNDYFNYKLKTKKTFFLSSLMFFFKKSHFYTSHIPIFKKDGKLLDIGCSYGNYLIKMKNFGWNVYGTEINEKAVKFANEELGLQNVQNIFFEDNSFEKKYFDVVNMNMVLEHVYDPSLTIKKVHNILKDEGELIFSVPDISGYEAKLHKEFAYTLQVPEHLHHFTPKMITKLLEDNGFEVIRIVHQNSDRDFVAPFNYKGDKFLSKVFHNKIIRKTVIKLFINFLAFMGKTSRMSIYARKQ